MKTRRWGGNKKFEKGDWYSKSKDIQVERRTVWKEWLKLIGNLQKLLRHLRNLTIEYRIWNLLERETRAVWNYKAQQLMQAVSLMQRRIHWRALRLGLNNWISLKVSQ